MIRVSMKNAISAECNVLSHIPMFAYLFKATTRSFLHKFPLCPNELVLHLSLRPSSPKTYIKPVFPILEL